MKYELSKTVFCPLHNRNETVYIYLCGDLIYPNGCDNANGSKACQNCIPQSVKGVTKADFERTISVFPGL